MRLMSSTSWEGIFTTIRNLFHIFMFYILKSTYLYRSRGYFFIHLIFLHIIFYPNFPVFHTYFSYNYFSNSTFFTPIFWLQFLHWCNILSSLIFLLSFLAAIVLFTYFFSTIFPTKPFASLFFNYNFYTDALSFLPVFPTKHFYPIFPGTIFSSCNFFHPFFRFTNFYLNFPARIIIQT